MDESVEQLGTWVTLAHPRAKITIGEWWGLAAEHDLDRGRSA